jgi:hypothetical protein
MARALLVVVAAAAAAAAAATAAGCSGAGLESADGGNDFGFARDIAMPPDFALPGRPPTDHPPEIQMTNHGGGVITAMELYTIVWQGDEALGAQIDTFHQAMLTSEYWTTRLGEYGIGAGTAKGVLVIPSAAPAQIDGSQIEQILSQNISSGAWPAPNANTVYSYIVPPTTIVTSFGAQGCSSFGGYHGETSARVPYLVNLQCTPSFGALTFVSSHEAAECATDPHTSSGPGWLADWAGEIADLCVGTPWQITGPAPDGGVGDTYTVTRLYSNAAAALGNVDPCGPNSPGVPYFGAALSPNEIDLFTDADGTGSVAVEVQPFAFGNVGKIRWTVILNFGLPAPGITPVPSGGVGVAGQTFPLTIKASAAAQLGSYPIMIEADAAGYTNTWFGILTVQ